MSTPFTHDLTISLIVKNEAKTLATCLEALAPLRNALSCQLIVTDTGSTDGTQEIAKEYADLFLEFAWCDDFAKARNHAIPHATGRWFFYLDADEVCDDSVTLISDFLNTPESHSTGAVTLTQRNYSAPPAPPYSDFQAPRLVNFGQGRRYFEGIIHESIAIHAGSGMLPVILHHNGYLGENSAAKEERNTPLLRKAVEEDPLDLRMHVHLIQGVSDLEEKMVLTQRALDLIQTHPTVKSHFFYPALLIGVARLGIELEDSAPLAQVRQGLLCDPQHTFTNTLPHLEFLGLELESFLEQEHHSSDLDALAATLLEHCLAYDAMYHTLEQTPDLKYHGLLIYRYNTPFHHARLLLHCVEALANLGQAEQANQMLGHYKGYQLKNAQNIYPLLSGTTSLCMELDHVAKLQEILLFLKEHGPENDVLAFVALLQDYLKKPSTPSAETEQTLPPPKEPTAFAYELTIGMIVKNEAHRLRGCLEGLAPLRRAIPCELIITDTGSTDGTQDIAKEFADVYLEFDWCQDFSKARNTTTAVAQGRWYIYLDADHTFDESILALADFLSSPQSHTPIQAATLSIRNYTNPQGTQFLDSTSCLLHNFSKGRKDFVYPVHECIQFYGDAPLLPVLIHHWGYLVEGEKQDRNHPILEKAVREDPLNFHHHHHLIRDTKDLTLRKQQIDHALSCAQQIQGSQPDPFYWTICLSACLWAWESKDISAFQEAKQRLLPTQADTFLHLELLGMEVSFLLSQAHTEEKSSSLLSLFAEYHTVFHLLQNCDSLPFRSSFRYQFTQTRQFYRLEVRLIQYFLDKQEKQEALQVLTRSSMLTQQGEDGAHSYLGDYANLTFQAGGFALLRSYHETLLLSDNADEHEGYLHYLEQRFSALPQEEKKDFLTAFSAQANSSYTSLWALRQAGYQIEKCPLMALKYLENTPDLYTNSLYRDVLYSSFRTGEDRFSFLAHSTQEHLLTQTKTLCALDPQCYKLIFQALDRFAQTSTPRLARIWGHLGLLALVEAGKHPKPSFSLAKYYHTSVTLLARSLTAVYQPHMLQRFLQEDHATILSPEEQFCLLASAALSDHSQATSLLSRGLAVYPPMKAVLPLL